MAGPDRKYLVSEHLKGFSAVQTELGVGVDALAQSLSTFGPYKTEQFTSVTEAFTWLFPVKTFVSRYLALPYHNWTLLLEDMYDQDANVNAYAIHRATLCKAIGITHREKQRALNVFENKKNVRWVESCDDGNRWHYLEIGVIQPFEDVEETNRPRKKDRLTVTAICRYFERYTGWPIPDWRSFEPVRIIGIERSLKDLQVSVERFETTMDL